MEMLFKDASIKNIDGKKHIQFLDANIENNDDFKKSFNNIVTLIDGYDIAKCSISDKKDIFYLYSFHTKINDIENTLNNAKNGNLKEMLNIDETNVLNAINDESTEGIYWDIINDLIVVIGLNNLKTLLLQLERKRWECIKIQNEKFMQEYMNLCASNVYKKVITNKSYR